MVSAELFDGAVAILGRMQTIEMFQVAAHAKPSSRIKVSRVRLGLVAKLAAELELAYVVGYDEIIPRAVAGRTGFSEWSTRTPITAASADSSYVYVARDRRTAERLRRVDELNDVAETGALLGYPTCCIRSFEVLPRDCDPVLQRYVTRNRISWYMNVSLLCFDRALISHVPCGPTCEKSLDLAASAYGLLFDLSRDIAMHHAMILASHVVHTQMFGVVAFHAEVRNGERLVIRKVAADPLSALDTVICPGVSVRDEGNGISIGNVFLDGVTTALLWFC